MVRYKRSDVKADNSASFILPQKPAGLLKNILPKDDTAVNLQFDAKNALIEFSGYKLVCRLVEGNYPNYEAVIYEDRKYTWTQVYKRTVKFASALNKIGVGKGDTVSFLAFNTPEITNMARLKPVLPVCRDQEKPSGYQRRATGLT